MSQSIGPDVYDREYFLSEICEGWDQFRDGRGVSFNKAKQVELLAPRPGLRILDAGCGRGEVLLACARRGAEVAGVDYSEAAVEITRETLSEFPGADVRVGDVTALPWPDDSFDRVQFSDVIEHLDPPQTIPALRELHRVLRPGGYLLVHTAPNRLFMDLGWPLVRPALRMLGHRAIVDGVDDWFRLAEGFHVNEQSLYSLRRALRAAGFERPRVWVDPDVLRSGRYHLISGLERHGLMGAVRRIAAVRPFRLVLGNDVFALADKAPDV
jgi:ubiquinone/menaquinone biosynthesis C-methylase UbiE